MQSRSWNRSNRIALALAAILLVPPVLAPGYYAADKAAGKTEKVADKTGKVADKTEKADSPSSPGMSQEEMMAAYMKYATPGPEHELLKSMAGTWKAVTKSWMGPGDPQVSEGRAVRSMILGGRFLKDEFTSTFMDQPFEGFGITGYDLAKKEYVATWSDSMGTSIIFSRGKADASGKVLTMTGTYEDPVTGEKKTMKEVTRIVDPNRHVFEIWEDQGGKEVKTMEITYTRD